MIEAMRASEKPLTTEMPDSQNWNSISVLSVWPFKQAETSAPGIGLRVANTMYPATKSMSSGLRWVKAETYPKQGC
jgi:hypothetical protein